VSNRGNSPFTGTTLALITVLGGLGVTGVIPVLLAIVLASIVYVVALIRQRPTALLIAVLVPMVGVALVLTALVILDAANEDPPPAVEPVDSTVGAAKAGAERRGRRAPRPQGGAGRVQRPQPARGTSSAQIVWGVSPDSADALGLVVSIGEVDLAPDGEDVIQRLLARVGDRRCPPSGAWRQVRTGDRFTIATSRREYVLFIDRVGLTAFEGDAETTITRRPRDRSSAPGCARS
jgi:hypothetical protein